MSPYAHPLFIDYSQQPFVRTMASPSEYSAVDNDRFLARTQHVMQEQPSEPETHQSAESDFVGFGDQFGDRRSSYPHQIEFSEGEDAVRQPRSPSHVEAFLNASTGTARPLSLGSPPTTPTPDRYQDARVMHPSDVQLAREAIRRGRRRRRPRSGTLLSLSLVKGSTLSFTPTVL